jgi:hypothetical protein
MENIAEFGPFIVKKVPFLDSKEEEVLHFIEKQFEYPKDFSLKADFPFLYSSKKRNHYLLFQDHQIMGHIGVSHRESNHPHYPMVALIGGVCLDPALRGQGLFHSFFTSVQKNINTPLMVLWSDKAALYQKYGFKEQGMTYVYRGQSPNPQFPTHIKEMNSSIDSIRMLKDYNEHLASHYSLIRDLSDIELIKESSMKIFGDHNIYFILGKGFDLENTVHEFFPLKSIDQLLAILPAQYALWSPVKSLTYQATHLVYSGLFSPTLPETKPLFIWGPDCV